MMNGAPEAPFADDFDEERTENEAEHWRALVKSAPSAWYSELPPSRAWLLRDARDPKARGVFPLGKVGQLIAEGGVGKTVVLCQLAVAVATATRWLGAFDTTKGRVVLVLGEEDAEEARRRLYHAAKVHRVAPESGSIEVLPLAGVLCAMLDRDKQGNATETAFLSWLREYIKAGGFRLVVVDPLSRFAGPDAERDNAVATRFVQALESLSAPDRSVLNAHHVNKGSRGLGTVDGSSGRGSSAFVDGARWQCSLVGERLKLDGAEEQAALGEVVTFAVTKSNYAAKPEPVLLRRDPEHGGALVPLDDLDLTTVERARTNTGKQAKKEAENRRRDADDDDAARAAIGATPDAGVRDLVAIVKKARACGSDRAHDAVRRVRAQTP